MRIVPRSVRCLLLPLCFLVLRAQATLLETTPENLFAQASGVCIGEVASSKSYRDAAGRIFTENVIRVGEGLKGQFPEYLRVTQRGGWDSSGGAADCLFTTFKSGEKSVFFLQRTADFSLRPLLGPAGVMPSSSADNQSALNGPMSKAVVAGDSPLVLSLRRLAAVEEFAGESFMDQAASAPPPLPNVSTLALGGGVTNLVADLAGMSARLTVQDRGAAVPYYIDDAVLPSGITREQALAAVRQALASWADATSLSFVFCGYTNLPLAAADMNATDGALYIQMHNSFGYINPATGILGMGGLRWLARNLAPGWGMGGNVAGNEFHLSAGGWVVLQHASPLLSDPVSLAEVLCHEIGHSLALRHSSTDPAEPSPLLKESVMYYRAHSDKRGPALTIYDTNVVRQAYPPHDIPPYAYNLYMDAVTFGQPNNVPFSSMTLRGYDLQNSPLELATAGASSTSGAFALAGESISFQANGPYEMARLDPAIGSHFGMIYFRFYDGRNASAYNSLRVLSLGLDRHNEGVPDNWRIKYFGNSDPSIGPRHHAQDDADKDGFTNIQEFRMGSDPTDRASNLSVSVTRSGVKWRADPCGAYELLTTTNLASWPAAGNPVAPEATEAILPITSAPSQFYKLIKVR